jgi:hypothetical protein
MYTVAVSINSSTNEQNLLRGLPQSGKSYILCKEVTPLFIFFFSCFFLCFFHYVCVSSYFAFSLFFLCSRTFLSLLICFNFISFPLFPSYFLAFSRTLSFGFSLYYILLLSLSFSSLFFCFFAFLSFYSFVVLVPLSIWFRWSQGEHISCSST